jgi:hypothetical protein
MFSIPLHNTMIQSKVGQAVWYRLVVILTVFIVVGFLSHHIFQKDIFDLQDFQTKLAEPQEEDVGLQKSKDRNEHDRFLAAVDRANDAEIQNRDGHVTASPLDYIIRHSYSPQKVQSCDAKYGLGLVQNQAYHQPSSWITVCRKTPNGKSELKCFFGDQSEVSSNYLCRGSHLAFEQSGDGVIMMGDCDWQGTTRMFKSGSSEVNWEPLRFPTFSYRDSSYFDTSCQVQAPADPALLIMEFTDAWNPSQNLPQHMASFATLAALGLNTTSGIVCTNKECNDGSGLHHGSPLLHLWQGSFGPLTSPSSLPEPGNALCVPDIIVPLPGPTMPFICHHKAHWTDWGESLRCGESPVVTGYGQWLVSKMKVERFDTENKFRIIYVSRNKNTEDPPRRKMGNEDQFFSALSQYAHQTNAIFNVVYPEHLTVPEQVNIMHRADLLVAPHGAAETWMVVMRDKKCGTVIEFVANCKPRCSVVKTVLAKAHSIENNDHQLIKIRFKFNFCFF